MTRNKTVTQTELIINPITMKRLAVAECSFAFVNLPCLRSIFACSDKIDTNS